MDLYFFSSLILAQWTAYVKPIAAFYLLPTRSWELLIGAFAAFYLSTTKRTEFGRGLSEFGGWLGLILIAYAIFSFSKKTPFPGIYALFPTVGATLIILFASNKNYIGKFIGGKGFVAVGLISYSAYLWHQPLFAFARNRSLLEPNQNIFVLLIISTLVLAFLSWKFIEAPFRKKNFLSRKSIFTLSVVFSFLFISFGVYGVIRGGNVVEGANAIRAQELGTRFDINYGLSIDCEEDFTDSVNCSTSDNPEVLLWGDSYAMHLAQGFLASNPNVEMVQKTVSMCGPFFDIAPVNVAYVRAWAERCISINEKVFEYLGKTPSIKYVVLSSPFDQFVKHGATVLTMKGDVVHGKDAAVWAMKETVDKIRGMGKMPVVFSPPPKNGQNIGGCLKKAAFLKADINFCNIINSEFINDQSDILKFIEEISSFVNVVNFSDYLCDNDYCRASVDGVFIYRDDGHLSKEGSAYLGEKINFYKILVDAENVEK